MCAIPSQHLRFVSLNTSLGNVATYRLVEDSLRFVSFDTCLRKIGTYRLAEDSFSYFRGIQRAPLHPIDEAGPAGAPFC